MAVIDWAARIEAISSRPEYQNALIRLHDDTLVDSEYDIETGEWVNTGDSLLVETRARIIGYRSQTDRAGVGGTNPSGDKLIRVQFPWAAYPQRVKRGVRIEVVDGGRNEMLESSVIIVEADGYNSNRASHTLECVVDVEAEGVPSL